MTLAMVDTVAVRSFDEIMGRVRDELGEKIFELWFSKARLIALRRGTLSIGFPNIYFREWVAEKHQEELARAAENVLGIPVRLELKVDPELFREQRRQRSESAVVTARELPQTVLPPDASVPQTLDTFVRTSENEYALRVVQHVAEDRRPRFNPLVLVGPSGVGKTHLLRALEHAGKRSGLGVRKSSALEFTRRFTGALKARSVNEFRASFEGIDLFVFDEVHRLRGKKATQREFLSLVSRLRSAGAQIAIAGRYHPRDIDDIHPALRGLLMNGMYLRVKPYAPESLVALAKATGSRGRRLEHNVLVAVASTSSGSLSEFRERLHKTRAYAEILGEEVDQAFVDRHLADLEARPKGGAAHFDALLSEVCKHYQVKPAALLSKKKVKSLILPRALLVFLLRECFAAKYSEIGRLLGGRSHTSAHLMLKKYGPAIREDRGMLQLVERIAESASSPARND